MKLSVVIPVYNEEATVAGLVKTVQDVKLDIDREIILIDDCSSDGTRKVLERLAEENEEIQFFGHSENRGKGAALHTGFDNATGELVIVQDADMEYDPKEYPVSASAGARGSSRCGVWVAIRRWWSSSRPPLLALPRK